MPTFRDLLAKAKAEINEIDTAAAEARIAAGGVDLHQCQPKQRCGRVDA